MVLESRVNTISFKLKEAEVIAQEAKERAEAVEAKAQAAEVEVTLANTRAIEEYKKSKDFKDEVTEATYDAFQLVFVECKKVTKAFLEFDLGSIIAIEAEQQEEGEAEEVEAGEVEESTREVTDTGTERASIQETITKVMAEAEAMINARVEAFEAGSTLAKDPEK